MEASYYIAAIDVHKSMLAVVLTDVAAEGPHHFERRKFGTLASDLLSLAEWLAERQVREVVMESTAQYWKPVWRQLEGQCQLHLAQAQSNRARKGRKDDFRDAERLARRYVADELVLKLCPGPRAAPVADTDPQQVPTHARPRPSGQSAGVSAGGRTHQAGHPGERSVGGQQPEDTGTSGRWRDRCTGAGGAGRTGKSCGPTRKSCATP